MTALPDPQPPRPRRTGRLFLAVGVVLSLALLAAFVVARRDAGVTGAATSSGPLAVEPSRDSAIVRLRATLAADPDDAAAWAELGAAYTDHARVNSDPSAYPQAEEALDRSLELDARGNWQALAAKGALAAGRHDFAPALRFSREALALQPRSTPILGVIVDALTDLGRYDEAIEAAQEMVDVRPNLASYARVSYQRELNGDVPGAIEAMQLARRSATTPGDAAFALFHLGELEWNRGQVDAAEAQYGAALAADPTASQALAGLGKVAAARGDLSGAIERYEAAVEGFPDPDALKELGELHLLNGDRRSADHWFGRSEAENAKQAAGGVFVDLETALFSADHRQRLDEGLEAARREWGRRRSVHVADALAWQLHANGRDTEALRYANRALALGTNSALFHFHRAEILAALGRDQAANRDYVRAAELNPNFSFLHQRRLRDRT